MPSAIRLTLCAVMAATATSVVADAGDAAAAARMYEELAPVASALNCYHDASADCTEGEPEGAASGEPAQAVPPAEGSGFGADELPSRE